MATVWFALISILLLFLYSFSLFVLFFADKENSLRFNCNSPSNLTACDPALRVLGVVIPDPLFPILCGILVLLSLIGMGFLGHLAGFHLYLSMCI